MMPQHGAAPGGVAEGTSAPTPTPPLLLLDCLHPSAFAAVSRAPDSADPQRCLRTLLRLLSNRHEHPTDTRYAAFSAVSTAWQGGVCPCVYVLRLVAWMTCAPDAEGARYVFQDCDCQLLKDRLDELRCVLAIWAISVSTLRTAATVHDESSTADVNEQSREEREEHLAAAREALTRLYTSGSTTLTADATRDAATSVTRALQLGLLSRAASVLAGKSPHNPTSPEAALCTSWLMRTPPSLRLFVPTTTPSSAAVEDPPLCWLLEHTSLCELTRECEDAAVASSPTALGATATVTALSPPLSSSSFSAVAERFKKQARVDQQRRYLDATGPAYRRLSQEERHRGESVVLDIAGLVEQLATVRETQGMVRMDRQEARRLLETFKQDGDLVALYALLEAYTAELEEAKRDCGKPLVYGDCE